MGDETQLKPCPFCGSANTENGWADAESEGQCNACGALGADLGNGVFWNTRPLEDAKDKRIAELEAAWAEEHTKWVRADEQLIMLQSQYNLLQERWMEPQP